MKKTLLIPLLIPFLLLVNTKIHSQVTKIMSFNIRYDNPNDGKNTWELRKKEVASFIEKNHPDFLGIQEGMQHQVAYIYQNTTDYSFIGLGRDGGTKGELSPLFYDNTKFRLLKQQTFWLSKTPHLISKGWDAALNRICTYGVFQDKVTERKITIFNTHFDHLGVKAKEQSAVLILQKIKEHTTKDDTVLLLGDFNSTPDSQPILTLKTGLNDGLELAKNHFYGQKKTFNGFDKLQKRIDYIFVKNATVKTYQHLIDKRTNGLWLSDHLPVLIAIKE